VKKFLGRLTAFLLLVLLGYAALFAATVYLHRRGLENCALGKPVDAVILGDSHTMWSIDDSGIEGLRNISFNAEGYPYSYDKLQHLLSHERGIRKLYVGLGYHNLSSYFDDYIVGRQFRLFADRYSSFLTLDDYLKIGRTGLLQVPLLTQQIIRKGLKPGLRQKCQIYGSFPAEHMTQTFDAEKMKGRLAEQFGEPGRPLPLSDLNLMYLGKIVQLAREHDVPMALASHAQQELREAIDLGRGDKPRAKVRRLHEEQAGEELQADNPCGNTQLVIED